MQPPKLSILFTVSSIVLSFSVPALATGGISAPLASMAMVQKELLVQQQMTEYLLSILNADPAVVIKSRKIPANEIYDLSEKDSTAQEKATLNAWAKMVNENTLQKNIEVLFEKLRSPESPLSEKIKSIPLSQQQYAKVALQKSIEAVVGLRGLTKITAGNKYFEWSALSQLMNNKINQSTSGQDHILDLADSKWLNTKSVMPLIDGEASFAKRDLLMKNAKKSINILTWSIYDDLTGQQTVDLLIKRKSENKNLKIRVIVDGQVSYTSGHGDQLKRLEASGIEVIRWISSKLDYVGQHRKMMIVDGQSVIAGGMNFGDVYSHKNPDLNVPRWRDTDLLIEGDAAVEADNFFAKIWNDQLVENKNIKFSKMYLKAAAKSDSKSNVQVSLINHDPRTAQMGSTVMLTVLKMIREAKTKVDIENAYIILFPSLKREIQAALQRNVKVRVLTNSSESVDEPVVNIPILRSVSDLVELGAEVYVKKGVTLHSKIMMVDSLYTMVMSYNLHPRSERIEGEMAVVVKDSNFTHQMHAAFEKDISSEKAYSVKTSKDVIIPDSAVSLPTLRIFFDML